MQQQVKIIAVVDVIGALSDGSLLNGNLCMIDNGTSESTGQGTPDLVTVVEPGQTVSWSALAVDLQTPVEIKKITFLGSDDDDENQNGHHQAETNGGHRSGAGESLEFSVWEGVVPHFAPTGVPLKYRLELQMYEGEHSVLQVESAALMCQ